MIVQPTFVIPPGIETGLLSGEYIRYGGVVRDTFGRLVAHLKEIPGIGDSQQAGRAAGILGKPALLVTSGALGVVAVGVAAVIVVRKKAHDNKSGVPEYVKNYKDSLHDYLEAVRNGNLNAEFIDRLIFDLDVVKGHSEGGSITVHFSTEQSEALVGLIVDYTRQLAAANSFYAKRVRVASAGARARQCCGAASLP